MYGVVVRMVDAEMEKNLVKKFQIWLVLKTSSIKCHVVIIIQLLWVKKVWSSLGAEAYSGS